MNKSLETYARSLLPQLIHDRRDLHRHPEPGWLEIRTATIVCRRLTDLGFSVKYGADILDTEKRRGLPSPGEMEAGKRWAIEQGCEPKLVHSLSDGFSAVMGSIAFGGESHLLIRFDMDALPIDELRIPEHRPYREGFSSQREGWMHACGHDAHTAIGLALARALAWMKKAQSSESAGLGTVSLLFQPAEEGLRGAAALTGASCLEGVDTILASHLVNFSRPGLLSAGVNSFLSSSKLDVEFRGKASHAGANPEAGHNALLAACSASLNLHAIPRHSGGASRVSVGQLRAGSSRNTVPDRALLKLETRGANEEVETYIRSYAEEILSASALMHGCQVSISEEGGSCGALCDREVVDELLRAGDALPCFSECEAIAGHAAGSEDFCTLLQEVQRRGGRGSYIQIASRPQESGSDAVTFAHHHPSFDIREEAMLEALLLYLEYLSQQKPSAIHRP